MIRAGGKALEAVLYRQPPSTAFSSGTIVFLHEALGSVSHWRDFPAELGSRSGWDLLLYSRAGHGNSEGPPADRTAEYYTSEVEIVLPAILQYFQVERPAFFAHSEGTVLAMLYAAAHPRSVRGLMLEAPFVTHEPSNVGGMEKALVAWSTTDFRERLSRHHLDPDAVFAAWINMRDTMPDDTRNLTGRLGSITCPLLAFLGENDEFVSTLQTEKLKDLLPQSEVVVIPDCGHTPHRERPELVLARCAAFLAILP
ncbi:MAG: alpha/beta fold hydrolase [Acidobacteriaceae bacterium]